MCEKKVCTKCKEDKSLSEYGNDKRRKDGKRSRCKKCTSGDYKEYHKNNPEKRKDYYENNRERLLKKEKIRRENTKEERAIYQKSYRENTKEERVIYQKEYSKKNKDKLKEYKKTWYQSNKGNRNAIRKRRYKEDILFRIYTNIRNAINQAYSKKGWLKKSRTQDILCCGYSTFEKHLNNNPYNFKVGNSGLDLDHIVPLSTATTEEELIKLNHYTNFQLLPSEYNQGIKRDNPWDKEDFENWLSENYSW